jgi:hypothetical protein
VILGAVFVLILARGNPSVLYYTSCRFRAYYPTGKWIGENVGRSNAVVFTRSSHQLRFYAKGDFQRDGGIFFGHNEWTGVPISAAEFHNVLDGSDKDAYLVVDIEEKSDPEWLYPPNQAAAKSIQSLGFQPVHLVWVPVGSLCDIPDLPYYADLPGFLKQFEIPLYRKSGSSRERVDAVIFKRDRATAVITNQRAPRDG